MKSPTRPIPANQSWLRATVVVLLLGLIWGCSKHPSERIDGAHLVAALQTYHQEMTAKGESIPETIRLGELLKKGYLQIDDLRPLEGYRDDIPSANFPISPDRPDVVIMRATSNGGDVIEVLADGRVVAVTAKESP